MIPLMQSTLRPMRPEELARVQAFHLHVRPHWFYAVVSALNRRPKTALAALDGALAKGFSRRSASEDDDFAQLRSLPEFKRLMSGQKGPR